MTSLHDNTKAVFNLSSLGGTIEKFDADYLIYIESYSLQLNEDLRGILYDRAGNIVEVNLYEDEEKTIDALKDAASTDNAEHHKKESVKIALVKVDKFYLV